MAKSSAFCLLYSVFYLLSIIRILTQKSSIFQINLRETVFPSTGLRAGFVRIAYCVLWIINPYKTCVNPVDLV